MLTILNSTSDDFDARLAQLLRRDHADAHDFEVEDSVAKIIAAVRSEGDAALVDFTARFDHNEVATAKELELSHAVINQAFESIQPEVRKALQSAAQRIQQYHQREAKQSLQSWGFKEEDDTWLGQRVLPLQRVGIYVPGGKASYPSSVLMTAIPAKVAGVKEIIMVVPAPAGELNQAVLAAAKLAGVDRVFTIGGAQAIAALAYATETVPAVDKIVGPGNRYVTAAKRQVFGTVGIDMLAGPSEVVVICDSNADSDWVAMDLFAQAEHDEQAQSIAITDSEQQVADIRSSIEKLLPSLPRREIITQSLAARGAIIKVSDLHEAVAVSNRIAPEHLELMTDQPEQLLGEIKHAGAVFVGAHSAESLGDYCAGPNHVLPTSGSARFSSPLGVSDFQKRSSMIYASEQGAAKMASIAATLASCEGLDAHARSAEYRLAKKKLD